MKHSYLISPSPSTLLQLQILTMKYLKGVLVGSVAAVIVTIIYAVLEIRKATAFARAAGFDGEVGVDLSFLMRDPQYLFLAVASFGIAFFLVLRWYRRK
jgi:hypothetical protein